VLVSKHNWDAIRRQNSESLSSLYSTPHASTPAWTVVMITSWRHTRNTTNNMELTRTSGHVQSKSVPLHAMEALGGRGSIAPTHSRPRHYMGFVVSVTPRPRFTPGKRTPGTYCTGGWVGPRAGLNTEDRGKILCSCRGSNLDRPVVQSVVRHYTAWATRLLQDM
jgi:hypothetical protein